MKLKREDEVLLWKIHRDVGVGKVKDRVLKPLKEAGLIRIHHDPVKIRGWSGTKRRVELTDKGKAEVQKIVDRAAAAVERDVAEAKK